MDKPKKTQETGQETVSKTTNELLQELIDIMKPVGVHFAILNTINAQNEMERRETEKLLKLGQEYNEIKTKVNETTKNVDKNTNNSKEND